MHIKSLKDEDNLKGFKKKSIRYYFYIQKGLKLCNEFSYLMMDMKGNPTWFIVKDETAMQDIQDMLAYDNAPTNIQDKISKRTHVPFFYSKEDFQTPLSDWEPYLHPILKTIQQGDKRYYISLISNENSSYKLDKPVLSYQSFLEAY